MNFYFHVFNDKKFSEHKSPSRNKTNRSRHRRNLCWVALMNSSVWLKARIIILLKIKNNKIILNLIKLFCLVFLVTDVQTLFTSFRITQNQNMKQCDD